MVSQILPHYPLDSDLSGNWVIYKAGDIGWNQFGSNIRVTAIIYIYIYISINY